MFSGWYAEEHDLYFKNQEDATEWCVKQGYASLDDAYDAEAIYWTDFVPVDERPSKQAFIEQWSKKLDEDHRAQYGDPKDHLLELYYQGLRSTAINVAKKLYDED